MRRHIRHACDSCKRRKAKCDGEPPQCSSCRALGAECLYSLPRAKRGPKPRASRTPSATNKEQSGSTPNFSTALGGHQSCPSEGTTTASLPSLSQAGTSSPWTPSRLAATPGGEWPGTPRSLLHRGDSPLEVHEHLTSSIESLGLELEPLARQCMELWTDLVFPIIPIFCPRVVSESIPLLLPAARHRFASAVRGTPSVELEPHGCSLEDMRSFALITAFCALMLGRSPDGSLPENQALSEVFYASSRGMLLLFEDIDVAQPALYSPIIRIIHSSVLHCQGKNRMSRFLVGQALRLTLDMRLFDENSFANLDEQESQLRRNLFWVMYTVDKSLSLLNNLPPTLYDRLADPTHLELGPDGTPLRLLDGMTDARYHAPYESRLRPAFDLSNKQWLLAGDIVRDLDLLSRLCKGSTSEPDGLSSLRKDVTQSYTAFCSLLDLTPLWVSDPESHAVDGEAEEVTSAQRRGFWSQHANLIVTCHCLKLILMVKAFKLGFADLLGLANNEELFALRNTEVACELVNDTARVPLQALRANGEAMVEKLRQVGVILLEISHRVSNEAIATRAKALFTRLLDLIASLDSKSSDNFGEEAP